MSSLAAGNEPLVLADGTKINPLTGKPIRQGTELPGYVAVPAASDAIKKVTAVRRQLSELPAPPKQMNAISVICFYSMMGLCDEDISIATGMPVADIGRIKMMEAYETTQQAIVKSVQDNDTENVRVMLANASKKAANKMVSMLDAESDALVFNAAKDILDRAGHRPADIVDHRLSIAGGIRIEYVKREEVPTVTIEGDF